MVLILLYIGILILLFSPVNIRFLKDKAVSYLEIRILYLIKFKINKTKIDKLFNKFKDKSIEESISDIKILVKQNYYIKELLKKITIYKFKLIYYQSYYDINLKEAFLTMESYQILKRLNHSLFKSVKDENYYLMLNQDRDLSVDIDLGINTFYLIYYSIIIFIKKRSYLYERS